MKRITTLLSIIALIAFFSSNVYSQEVKARMGGTVQFWASNGQINAADTGSTGFGLRRARLRSYVNVGDNVKGFVQMELTSFKLLDARIEYMFNKNFSIRVGRFIGAGVRSAGLTSHTSIDITERPFTAQRWGASTIGADYRDYGVDLVATFGGLKVNATVHNGNGALNIRNRMSGPSTQNGGFAVSGMVSFKPKEIKGLETGAYYGMGNKEINEYSAYNAYVYFEPKPIRLKAEVIGWTNTMGNVDVSQMGFYVMGAYQLVKNWELVARFENYDSNTDVDDNERSFVTVGATYSMFSKWTTSKITAAYVLANEDPTVDNNTFQIVCQLVF